MNSPNKGSIKIHKIALPIATLKQLKTYIGTDLEFKLRVRMDNYPAGIYRGDKIDADFHYKGYDGRFELLVINVYRTRVPRCCEVGVKVLGVKNRLKLSPLEEEARRKRETPSIINTSTERQNHRGYQTARIAYRSSKSRYRNKLSSKLTYNYNGSSRESRNVLPNISSHE